MGNKVQIRITGKSGTIDGYAEIVLGALMLSGVMFHAEKPTVKKRAGGVSQIYLDLDLGKTPLGDLGESDMQEYKGDTE